MIAMDLPRLIASGTALYGPRWQSELARTLGVNDRRVRQWLTGERPIPTGIWPDIDRLLIAKREQIDALLPDRR